MKTSTSAAASGPQKFILIDENSPDNQVSVKLSNLLTQPAYYTNGKQICDKRTWLSENHVDKAIQFFNANHHVSIITISDLTTYYSRANMYLKLSNLKD